MIPNIDDSENRNIMQEQLQSWLPKQGYFGKLATNIENNSN